MNYTIEQLQAMSDEQLAELTARLRGWTVRKGFIYDENGKVPTDSSHRLLMLAGASSVAESWYWNPAADIGQAYGLLTWITVKHGLAGWINLASPPSIELWKSGTCSIAVPHNDARAMCYAFVLAMQAMQCSTQ